jgi:hypothetical protein
LLTSETTFSYLMQTHPLQLLASLSYHPTPQSGPLNLPRNSMWPKPKSQLPPSLFGIVDSVMQIRSPWRSWNEKGWSGEWKSATALMNQTCPPSAPVVSMAKQLEPLYQKSRMLSNPVSSTASIWTSVDLWKLPHTQATGTFLLSQTANLTL